MSRDYRSAQHAADAWCRLTTALRSVGAVDYNSDDTADTVEREQGDPTDMLVARAELTSVFEAAEERAGSIQWMHWLEHRMVGTPLAKLPVSADHEDDWKSVLWRHIGNVDTLVEDELGRRGMLVEDYQTQSDDRGDLEEALEV